MTGAEHPLIAAHRAHTAPDLVRECLKTQPMIGGGQRTTKPIAGAGYGLCLQKFADGLFVAPFQQHVESTERNQAAAPRCQLAGQMKTMHGIQKEQRPHPFIEIRAALSMLFQRRGFGQQLLCRSRPAEGIQ